MAPQDQVLDTIEATVNYHLPTGETPFVYSGGKGSTVVQSSGNVEPHKVRIRDARPIADRFTLERNGFHFIRHDTKVVNFYDEVELERVYYPEMEALIKQETGAARVVVFDHTLRTGDDADREARKIREPVLRVHNDYTEWSGPNRVREVMGDEAEALLQHRVAVVQVWRPIRLPVLASPLAICDAQSMAPEDFVISERRYPNRIGQTYTINHNPNHRWYWFPRMRREEALVFKVYDSLKDGRARWTAHTAFEDPHTPKDAPPRESIEIRTLAFFAPG
jgi:hypothetical protein